jgi:O-antigen/teichoic acid export membrane protein
VLVPLLFVEGLLITSLQAMHREHAVVRFMLIGLVAGVATNVALVPVVGAIGAVAAQVVASAVRLAMGMVAIKASGLFQNAAVTMTASDGSAAVEGIQHAAV